MNTTPHRDSGPRPISPLPHRFNATGIYELPSVTDGTFLKSGILSHVIGNWQVALTYDFQQGPVPYLGQQLLLRRHEYGRRHAGSRHEDAGSMASTPARSSRRIPPISLAAFQARVSRVDITSVRADGLNQWSGNLRRDFRLREGTIFEVRVDALNLFQPLAASRGAVTNNPNNHDASAKSQARPQR